MLVWSATTITWGAGGGVGGAGAGVAGISGVALGAVVADGVRVVLDPAEAWASVREEFAAPPCTVVAGARPATVAAAPQPVAISPVATRRVRRLAFTTVLLFPAAVATW
jgi:hypothetical protein